MSTAAANALTTENQGTDRIAGILEHRFQFLGSIRSSGAAGFYSVRCRPGEYADRYGEAGLALWVLDDVEPARVELFKARVRAAGMLDHQSITPVLESDEFNGIQYCLLRFPSAFETVRHRMARNGWLRIEEAATSGAILQVSDALSYAHRKGVLHLAIGPDDILIEPQGRVFLTGFGLLSEDIKPHLLSELAGQIDPCYASPELLRGQAATERSDLYSLGVALYEMLTDRIPTVTGAGSGRAHTRPPAPPHIIMDSISPEVSGVIMRLLEQNPADRYRDVVEFQAALIGTVCASEPYRPVTEKGNGYTDSMDSMAPPMAVIELDVPDLWSLFERVESAEVPSAAPPPSSIQGDGIGGWPDLSEPHCLAETGTQMSSCEAEVWLPARRGDSDVDIDKSGGDTALGEDRAAVEIPLDRPEQRNDQTCLPREEIQIHPANSQTGEVGRGLAVFGHPVGKGRIARTLSMAAGLVVLLSALVIVGDRLIAGAKVGRKESGQATTAPALATQPDQPQDRTDLAQNPSATTQQPVIGAAGNSSSPVAADPEKAKPGFRKSQSRHRRSVARSHWQPRWRAHGRASDYYE